MNIDFSSKGIRVTPGFDELMQAIDDGDANAVRQIVAECPALLEQTGHFGQTPLMHAASCSTREVAVIRALLAAGAAINRQTAEGYTALHSAIDVNGEANLNSRDVIALLVSAGADLTLRQHYGWTPLLNAVVQGTSVEVEALLEAGGDPNDKLPADTLPTFNSGRTALMAAISTSENEAKVELLLKAGADPNDRDLTGATFFDFVKTVLAQSPRGEFAESVLRCRDIAIRHLSK